MPDFADRYSHEDALAAEIAAILADLEGRIARGEIFYWLDVQREIAAKLEAELTAVFLIIFLMMADEGLSNLQALADSVGRAWAKRHADKLASYLAGNLSRELARGIEASRVLSPARAERLAITEVTRAITAAETEARRANAELMRRRGESVDVPSMGPLDVGDGLVPVWITVKEDLLPGDSPVCPVCLPLHKKPYPAWKNRFPNGTPAHEHCRCHLEYVPRDAYRAANLDS